MQVEIVLGEVNEDLCHAWRSNFHHRAVTVVHGDFFDIDADAYDLRHVQGVTPKTVLSAMSLAMAPNGDPV